MNNWNIGNLEGLIPLLCGIYCYLAAIGVLPRKPKEPEKVELWRRKFGRMMKILSPFLIISGILHLVGVL